mmetsp:Transcript_28073/g.78722  ORF Transcript_28073/g.78722 Transcript_28073/m.78722 type:complete len:628 (+) Transcript_28073:321-2204(+)|eukprot:CAMPEP_0119549336 /NCGR_PEP_ID=MMETSP1352-20130426/3066_1 /TAXON_ID=265584 /ORGANISM="Stauroneis constricta, Strain CCMP1120" /LENGTH=627 /DNA_ID=CAMNT_0007594869 /DNA_START=342 /DNA_END=2225 /DNA_ORIENTATION=+
MDIATSATTATMTTTAAAPPEQQSELHDAPSATTGLDAISEAAAAEAENGTQAHYDSESGGVERWAAPAPAPVALPPLAQAHASAPASTTSATATQQSANIPVPQANATAASPAAAAAPSSQPGSVGSNGSGFMTNILNGGGDSFLTENGENGTLSRTPPSQLATSYETTHFGKRPRAGSVSERLKSAAELEEKGVIDREQKAIMKDLLISGNDELQVAIDKYDQGDQSMLQEIIEGGALSNDAANEIDLLGNLNLDYMNVEGGGNHLEDQALYQLQGTGGASVTGSDSGTVSQNGKPLADFVTSSNNDHPPSTVTPHIDSDNTSIPPAAAAAASSSSNADGPTAADYLSIANGTRSRSGSLFSLDQSMGLRSRSNSTWSNNNATATTTDNNNRNRSNSLFSALIGAVSHQQEQDQYGNWMESNGNKPQSQQTTEQQESNDTTTETTTKRKAPKKKGGMSNLSRMMNANDDPVGFDTTGMTTKEIKAEVKRREKEEKQRIRFEKREKRERLKLERKKKKKIVQEEERIEHVPGCGRPRALSDPLLQSSIGQDGLLYVDRPKDWIGAYSPQSRRVRIERFWEKRKHRVWTKTVKYDVRKNFADSRLRVKGRFVKKEDELMMRELMSLT